MREVQYSFPVASITKANDDGDFHVTGIATDASVDYDGQIVHPDWAEKAFAEWMKRPNLRVQHSAHMYPAGKGVQYWREGNAIWVKSLVCEDNAKKLVKKGVLTAYSVGIGKPVINKSPAAPGGIIVGGMLVELSLVDRPANANCGITIAKSVGGKADFIGKAWNAKTLTKAQKKAIKGFRPDRVMLEAARLAQFSDDPQEREFARMMLR